MNVVSQEANDRRSTKVRSVPFFRSFGTISPRFGVGIGVCRSRPSSRRLCRSPRFEHRQLIDERFDFTYCLLVVDPMELPLLQPEEMKKNSKRPGIDIAGSDTKRYNLLQSKIELTKYLMTLHKPPFDRNEDVKEIQDPIRY